MDIKNTYAMACQNLPKEIHAAEAEGRREEILSVTVSGGAVIASQSSDVTTVSVLAEGTGGIGYAFTQDLQEPAMDVIHRAWEGSRTADGTSAILGDSAEADRQGSSERMDDLPDVCDAAREAGWLEDVILNIDRQRIVQAEVTIRACRTGNWTVNSLGLDRSACHVWYDAEAELVLNIQGKTCNTSWCTSVSELQMLHQQADEMKRSIQRNIRGKGEPVPFTSGIYRAILSREALCQMLVCMWQPFSGVRQMNGSSCLIGKEHQIVGSPALTIADTAFLDRCGYGRGLDTEGTPAGTQYLMKNGVVSGRLHNRRSAAYFGETPTGNANRAEGFFSGLPTGITATPNLTYIVPGDLEEETMLERLGDGVWITETYDPFHSIEPASGDFAIPCNGVLVRNGQIAGVLNSLTITGNLLDLWHHVEAVGTENRFWRFYTGLYYLGGADLLVSELQING